MYIKLFDIVPPISDALFQFFFSLSVFKFIYPFLCVSNMLLSPLNHSFFLCPVSLAELEKRLGAEHFS